MPSLYVPLRVPSKADAVRATRDHRGILGIPITFDDKGDVAGGVIYFYQVKGPGFEQVKAITVK